MKFNLSKDASTCLKGFSCLLIVLHHWCSGLSGVGYDNILVKLLTQAGGVTGVAIFFFLSSYGLTRSQLVKKDSISLFFTKRLSKVFVPLVLTNALWLAFRYNGQGFVQSFLQILNLSDLLDLATWFCNIIIVCYVIFYASNHLKSDWMKVSVSWILIFVLAVILVAYFPYRPCYVYSLVAFPLGGMVAILQDRMKVSQLMMLTFVPVAAVIGALAEFCTDYKAHLLANLYCCAVIFCLMLIVMGVRNNRASLIYESVCSLKKPASFIGLYSYEIYLLHNKFLMLHSDYHVTVWYPITVVFIVLPLAVVLYMCDKQLTKLMVKK
jgi:peptidoglycan/LPS O-acetylase OafA/YrhL